MNRDLLLGAVGLLCASVGACALVPAAARADLRSGSAHAIVTGKRLSMPMPQVTQVPVLRQVRSRRSPHAFAGSVRAAAAASSAPRLVVTAKARYVAANWSGRRGVRPDRAMVTFSVARRLRPNGPDLSSTVYRRVIVHSLRRSHASRTYRVVLPPKVARFLRAAGAFSSNAGRRAQARRLVTVDVQQDRDFKQVDGAFDWRQGTAWTAADRLPSFAGGGPVARAAAGSDPSATVSVTNATAWGVLPSEEAYQWNTSTDATGAEPGTANDAQYAVPLVVGGDAVQCFYSNSHGSSPYAFANFDANGFPQPYQAGTAGGAQTSSAGAVLQSTSGTTVTETIVADDSLAWMSDDEVSGIVGGVDGVMTIGWQVLQKLGVESLLPSLPLWPSPGSVVSGVLDVAEFLVSNSCDGNLNLWNLSATEPAGSTVSNTMDADIEGEFSTTTPVCYAPAVQGKQETPECVDGAAMPSGLQLNPSQSTYQGLPVQLNQFTTDAGGVAKNGNATNTIALGWADYGVCDAQGGGDTTPTWSINGGPVMSASISCTATPTTSPEVGKALGVVGCGTSNYGCPFPAASWPPAGEGGPSGGRSGPTTVYAGSSTGQLTGCPTSGSSQSCTLLNSAATAVNDLAGGGEGTLYAALQGGGVWKCTTSAQVPCLLYDQWAGGGSVSADSIAVTDATYVGLSNGTLWRCSRIQKNDCGTLDDSGGTAINTLLARPGALFAGLDDGVLWKCNPTVANTCETLDTALGTSITSLTVLNGYLYAGLASGVLWQCSTTVANECQPWASLGHPVLSLAVGNGSVYAGLQDGRIMRCSPAEINQCTELDSNAGGYPITALAAVTGTIFGTLGDVGILWRCVNTANGCTDWSDDGLGSLNAVSTEPSSCGDAAVMAGANTLALGQTITSPNGSTTLTMQPGGNLVLTHQDGSGQTAPWASNTVGEGSQMAMQSDGNLVVDSNTGGTPPWASGTSGNDNAYLAVQDDGNLVVYSQSGNELWSSGTVRSACS